MKIAKEFFYNININEDPNLYEEYENIQMEDDLKYLVYVSRGLPKAAMRLQILYKNAAGFKKCILWGLVSCYAGYHSNCVLQDIGVAILMRDGKL